MKRSSIIHLGIFGTFLFLACNIFNPSGEGDLPDDAGGMVSVGQTRLRNKDWDGAMEAFAAAIAQDSTNSLAYYSYAKAVRFKYDLNGLTISKELTDTVKDTTKKIQIPFANMSPDTANRYYQATQLMLFSESNHVKHDGVLKHLIRRDSLQQTYKRFFQLKALKEKTSNYSNEKYLNTCSPIFQGKTDTLCTVLHWIKKAQNGEEGYYDTTDYPIMDGVINMEKVITDYSLLSMLHTVISLKDLNGDGVIDSTTDKITLVNDLLSLFNSQNGKPDGKNIEAQLATMMDSVKSDTQKVNQINNLLDKMSEGTQGVSEMVGFAQQLGIVPASTDTSTKCDSNAQSTECKQQGALSGDLSATVASLGDRIVFYKFGDKLDNDGDGCVDEEVLDQKDNDGDGIVDEDSRLVPYIIEIPIGPIIKRDTASLGSWIKPDSIGGPKAVYADTLTKRVAFTTETGFWADTSKAMAQRFKVLDYEAGKKPPYTLTSALMDSARVLIGGCWNKYK